MSTYDPTKPFKGKIQELIQETWQTPYVSVEAGLYGIVKKKISFPEVDHTDGIGTKGIYHWQAKTFRNAVMDALAMNLNDLALVRATPYKLQNHLTLPLEDEHIIEEIMRALVSECKARKIAVTGGETSIHTDASGMDLSITMSGFITEQKVNVFQPGDHIFGMQSSGLHSNGFTKVRELFGNDVREEFIIPTQIYIDDILCLDKLLNIHGMMHITGGAFTKLKDVGEGVDIILKHGKELAPQKIFYEIYQKGVLDEEMYQTFNCGIGFVFSVSEEEVHKIPKDMHAFPLGKVQQGSGKVSIISAFSGKEVIL